MYKTNYGGGQKCSKIDYVICERPLMRGLVDGCYSSKFLRISARHFHLEMLVRGMRYEEARAGLVH